jgi:hypothetical protein
MSVALLNFYARRQQRMAAVPFSDFIVARIRAGQKRLAEGTRREAVDAGHYLVVTPGLLLNVENLPASDGPYLSSCVVVSRELLLEKNWTVGAAPTTWAVLPPSPALDQAFAHAESGLQQQLPQTVLVHRVRELLEALDLGGFRPVAIQQPALAERVRMLLAATPHKAWRAEDTATALAAQTGSGKHQLPCGAGRSAPGPRAHLDPDHHATAQAHRRRLRLPLAITFRDAIPHTLWHAAFCIARVMRADRHVARHRPEPIGHTSRIHRP